MSIDRLPVSGVRALPCSSRLIISSNRRATRSASRCSPEMVISLPRTKTVLSKAASMSLSSSSLVPSRLTIEWLPGTRTLTCVCCCTLACGPSIRVGDAATPWAVRCLASISGLEQGSLARASAVHEAFDRYRLDLLGQLEAEDAAVEVQLGLDRPLDVLGLAQAVALAGEDQVGVGHVRLGGGRVHPRVVGAGDQDDGAGDRLGGLQGRALPVQGLRLRPGTDQLVEV